MTEEPEEIKESTETELVEPTDDQLYTVQEVAQMFRVSVKTVGRWDKSGKFKSEGIEVLYTWGGHRRFRKSEIDKLIQKTQRDQDA